MTLQSPYEWVCAVWRSLTADAARPTQRYVIATTLMVLLSPFLMSVGLFGIMVVGAWNSFVSGFVGLLLAGSLACFLMVWVKHTKWFPPPDSVGARLLPVTLGFVYYVGLWIFLMRMTDGFAEKAPYVLRLTLPHWWGMVRFVFNGEINLFPRYYLCISAVMLVLSCIACRKAKLKRCGSLVAQIVLLSGLYITVAIQCKMRNDRIIAAPPSEDRLIGIDPECSRYDSATARPEREKMTVVLDASPSLIISNAYPVLYAPGIARLIGEGVERNVYTGFSDDKQFDAAVNNRKVAILLEAPQETDENVSDVRTPIGREALVFFVNAENPVTNVTSAQLQSIYRRQIKNWRVLQGADLSVQPFKPPEGSTAGGILWSVMDVPVQSLFWERVPTRGGSTFYSARYRNLPGAMGCAFRADTLGLVESGRIRCLAVDGIPPTKENIRSGAYPHTLTFVAVTRKRTAHLNVQRLVDWLLSEEGADFIEQCGFVAIRCPLP